MFLEAVELALGPVVGNTDAVLAVTIPERERGFVANSAR
jgi:hypothetical protein